MRERLKLGRIAIGVAVAALIFAAAYAGVVAFYGMIMEPEAGSLGMRAFAAGNVAVFVAVTGTAVMTIANWAAFKGSDQGHMLSSAVVFGLSAAGEASIEALVDPDGLGPVTVVGVLVQAVGAMFGGMGAKMSTQMDDMREQLARMSAPA